jgi:hypothetical protein
VCEAIWPEAPQTVPVTMFGMSGLHHLDVYRNPQRRQQLARRLGGDLAHATLD